jgi:hypothetical protein
MATDTAPAPTAAPPRRLWQLPTFVAGLAALYAAYTYAPVPPADPAAAARSALGDLRSALDRRPVDVAAVQALVRTVADAAASPDLGQQADFLAGSGYLALAEHDPAAAGELWATAARHLERCDPAKLSTADAPRLVFRTAKAKAAAGTGDPAKLLTQLGTPPQGEDRGECPRLTAETALRLNPPDVKRARDELAVYLGGAHRQPPPAAARLKLKLADLNLTLNDPDKARAWLKDIGPAAPSDVQASAKVQLARLAAAENNWPEAVQLFETAAGTAELPPDQVGQVRYQTGVALLRLNRVEQAVPYFEQAARDGGPVAAAAAVRLAEVRVRDPKAKGTRTAAADWLEKAVAPPGPDPLVPANEVRAAFEEVIKTCAAEADFPSGLRAATAYAAVAENGKDREYRAEINAAWADALAKSPQGAGEAKAKLRAAADEYAGLADRYPTPAGKADLLRRAAAAYRQAGDPAGALAAVNKLLAAGGVPDEHAGAAWVEKGDLLPDADFDGKKAAYEKAMLTPTPAAAEARYRSAMLYLNRGYQLMQAAAAALNPDPVKAEAEAAAKLGRDLLAQMADAATVPPAERATHEEAIFELGRLLMGGGRYADAVARFRTQLKLYPAGPKAGYGRLWLACCLVSQAGAETPVSAADPRLTESLSLLEPLLGSADPFLKAQAEIRTLNTLVVMKKFDQVVARGGPLLDAYAGRPDMLTLGELVFHAHLSGSPPQAGEAVKVLDRMEAAYKGMPKAAFPLDPAYSYESWQQKLPAMRAMYMQVADGAR